MGSAASTTTFVTHQATDDRKHSLLIFESLGLTSKQIEEFAQTFWFGRDRQTSLTLDEIVERQNFDSVWLTKLLFKSIELCTWEDVDDGIISFIACIVAVWNLCTAPPTLLADMLFWYVRTVGRTNFHIGHRSFNYFEIENHIQMEFGVDSSDAKNLREMLTALPFDDTGYISRSEFVTAAVAPGSETLAPLLNFQRHLRTVILTPVIWEFQTKRRAMFFGDKKIWDIIPNLNNVKQQENVSVCVGSISRPIASHSVIAEAKPAPYEPESKTTKSLLEIESAATSTHTPSVSRTCGGRGNDQSRSSTTARRIVPADSHY